MTHPSSHKLKAALPYAVAPVTVAVAVICRLVLDPVLHDASPFMYFFVAIIVSAWLGGLGPGLTATVLSGLAVDAFYLTPKGSVFTGGARENVQVISFMVLGSLVCLIVNRMLREQRRAQSAEIRYRATFEKSAMGIVITDDRDRFVAVNDRLCQILGYEREEMLGMSVHELTAPEDRGRSDDLNAQLHDGRIQRIDYEKRYLHKNGTPIWVHVTVGAVRDGEGRYLHSIGTVENITRRRAAEDQLRLQSKALDAAGNGIIVTDPNGTILWANPAYASMIGYEVDEVIGKNPRISKSGRQDQAFYRAMWETIGRGEVWHGELINRRKDGTLYHEEMVIAPVLDERGAVTHYIAIKQNISERKQIEQRLMDSERRLTDIIEFLPDATFALDNDGRIIAWNKAMEELTRTPAAEVMGKGNHEYTFRLYGERIPCLADEVLKGVEPAWPYSNLIREMDLIKAETYIPHLTPGGVWLSIKVAPMYDAQGNVVGVIDSCRDITDRKQAEEALRESEARVRRKLESVLSPEDDLGVLELVDLIDTMALQKLMDDFYAVAQIPLAIVDIKGKVLVGVGWQDICTRFHRVNPETCRHCIESDTQLSAGLGLGEFRLYKCKNNMWDMATPIVVAGQHVGNIFTGQFIFEDEQVDREVFRAQARRYGFDEEEYLNALDRAPRLSRQTVDRGMAFLLKLADTLSQLGFSNVKLARLLTERDRLTDSLRESEFFFRQTLESIPGMVFTTRPDGYCDYQSQQWVDYTGVPEQEMLGDGWNRLLHPDDRPGAYAAWRDAVEGRAPYDLEYRVRRHDGVYEWFKVRGQPIHNAAGKIVRWFGVATNIDEFKRAQEALSEADRRKDDFMAMLAHELRNPLAPIRYAVYMLNQNGGQDQINKQRDIIDRQVSHMGRLLDDLLEVSRVTRGKITLKNEIVDLRTIATHAVDSMRPMIEGRGQHLLYQAAPVPLLVNGDPTRLEQIIRNLLHNANKYTEGGGCIKLSLMLEMEANEWLAAIRVIDSGIGIEPKMLPLIFEPFVQAEQGLARTQGGLGIGLAMVKNLVHLHGGDVEAHSNGPGHGSEFVVRLPVVAEMMEPSANIPASVQAAAHESHKPRRILVVDDNEDAVGSLGELLSMWGHEIQTAHDGRHALQSAQEFHPEIVLLDIGLPGMDGYEVARRLREDPATSGAFIVALTGYGQDEDRRRAQEAGFDRHLTKPVEIDQLQTMLDEAC